MKTRPLSPHLQIYRLPLVVLLSITHRITGVALGAGTLVLLYWLQAVARGPDAFNEAHQLLGSGLVSATLIAWTWAFFYHLCNGLRHLCWDAGWGFEISTANTTAYLVLAASTVLTLLVWAFVFAVPGGVA